MHSGHSWARPLRIWNFTRILKPYQTLLIINVLVFLLAWSPCNVLKSRENILNNLKYFEFPCFTFLTSSFCTFKTINDSLLDRSKEHWLLDFLNCCQIRGFGETFIQLNLKTIKKFSKGRILNKKWKRLILRLCRRYRAAPGFI